MSNADAILYGMPMDWTVSYRPGSRFGLGRIREVSIGLEEYSPYLDRDLADLNFFDADSITSKELLASIHDARSEVNVKGADLVEVAPVYNHSEQTAITASKIIREILLGFVK